MAGIDLKSVQWRRVVPLALVAAVAAAFTVYRVRLAVSLGPEWDAYAFLANAAEFAGKGYGYTELHRPPFLSLLTAILFRIGAPLDASVIQWVDGAVSFSGVVAAYIFARRRMPQLFAGAAALSLFAVQPLWVYLGSGYTDFPSVAISLWMLLACIKATEEDSRFYAVTAVLFVAAVMTRYTALLTVFPAILWIALRGRPFRHARALGAAAIAAFAVYAPAAVFYTMRFNDALFPFAQALSMSEEVSAPTAAGVPQVASGLWYLQNLPSLIAPRSVWALTVLGIAIGALGLAFALREYARSWRPGVRDVVVVILGVAPAVAAQVAGAGLMARQFTIPIAVYALWRFQSPRDERGFLPTVGALDAAMLAWLLAYFDFHGHQNLQIDRYFITMVVPLLYFSALGWYKLSDRLVSVVAFGGRIEPGSRVPSMVTTATAAGFAAIAVTALAITASAMPPRPMYVAAARESSAWLVEQGVGRGDVVYSDLWPLTAWYARSSPRPMPIFKDGRAFQHELDKSSASYYVTIFRRRFEGYTEVKRMDAGTDVVVLLKRTSYTREKLPQVLYLGTSWTNYLESLSGYSFDLDSTAGRYGLAGTAFLDALTPEQMNAYDVVTASDFKWHKHSSAENGLRAYVEGGGVLVIDASQNLNGLAYSVANTIMLDTVVRRATAPSDGKIQLAPEFAKAHPEVGMIQSSPFVDETGGDWNGAGYEARPDLAPLTTLASIGGQPAIQLQSLGKGHVYWIGYNLVWHAYNKQNAGEMRLIKAVFDDALASQSTTRAAVTP